MILLLMMTVLMVEVMTLKYPKPQIAVSVFFSIIPNIYPSISPIL